MTIFDIQLRLSGGNVEAGLNKLDRKLKSSEQQAAKLRRTINSVFGAGVAGLAIREFGRLTDTLIRAENRIGTVTRNTAELNLVTSELLDISKRTFSSFEAGAEVFARVGLSVKELGISQKETLRFTESLNKAVILSGSTAQESYAGIIQLSQGLASGTLRGDELRSVLEQLPVVADVIAEGLGRARGELRKLGSEGKITAEDVLRAFREATDDIDQRFLKIIPTIQQSFEVLKTEFIRLTKENESVRNINRLVSQSILFLADNLDFLAKAFTVVIGAISPLVAGKLLQGLVGGFTALNTIIRLNPFVAFVSGIAAAATALIAFQDDIKVTTDGVATLRDMNEEYASIIVSIWKDATSEIRKNFPELSRTFDDMDVSLKGFLILIARGFDNIGNITTGTASYLKAIWRDLGSSIVESLIDRFNDATISVNKFINKIITGINYINRFTKSQEFDLLPTEKENDFRGAGERLANTIAEGITVGSDKTIENSVTALFDRIEERAKKRIEEIKKKDLLKKQLFDALGDTPASKPEGIRADAQAVLDKLKQEAFLLGLTADRRKVLGDLLKENDKIQGGLNETEQRAIEQQLEKNRIAEIRSGLLDELNGKRIQAKEQLEALNQLYIEGDIALGPYLEKQKELAALLREPPAPDDLLGGIKDAYGEMADAALTASDIISEGFKSSIDGLANAFTDLAIKGKADFAGLARSILADMARMAAKALILKALGIAFPVLGGGNAVAGAVTGVAAQGVTTGGNNAYGGSFRVGGSGGTDSQLVQFRATPGERVDVTRKDKEKAAPAPTSESNVKILNVVDPDMVNAFLSSPAGERVLVNTIRQNAGSINSVLGGGRG